MRLSLVALVYLLQVICPLLFTSVVPAQCTALLRAMLSLGCRVLVSLVYFLQSISPHVCLLLCSSVVPAHCKTIACWKFLLLCY